MHIFYSERIYSDVFESFRRKKIFFFVVITIYKLRIKNIYLCYGLINPAEGAGHIGGSAERFPQSQGTAETVRLLFAEAPFALLFEDDHGKERHEASDVEGHFFVFFYEKNGLFLQLSRLTGLFKFLLRTGVCGREIMRNSFFCSLF